MNGFYACWGNCGAGPWRRWARSAAQEAATQRPLPLAGAQQGEPQSDEAERRGPAQGRSQPKVAADPGQISERPGAEREGAEEQLVPEGVEQAGAFAQTAKLEAGLAAPGLSEQPAQVLGDGERRQRQVF